MLHGYMKPRWPSDTWLHETKHQVRHFLPKKYNVIRINSTIAYNKNKQSNTQLGPLWYLLIFSYSNSLLLDIKGPSSWWDLITLLYTQNTLMHHSTIYYITERLPEFTIHQKNYRILLIWYQPVRVSNSSNHTTYSKQSSFPQHEWSIYLAL